MERQDENGRRSAARNKRGRPHPDGLTLRERKRQRVHQAVIDATLDLYATRGYSATTIDEIAASAEVSRGTVFNYFDRKEGIVLAWAREVVAAIAAAIAEGRAADEPPVRLLQIVAETMLAATIRYPTAIRALICEVYAPDQPRAERAHPAFDLDALLAPIIAEGREAGVFRGDIAASRLGAYVADMLLLAATRAADMGDAAVIDDAVLFAVASQSVADAMRAT